MENFKLVFWSDVRGSIFIDDVKDVKKVGGKEVFEFVKDFCKESIEYWEEDNIDLRGGVEEEDLVEGNINDEIFNIMIGEESNCMVFKNFEGDVSEEDIMKYLEII